MLIISTEMDLFRIILVAVISVISHGLIVRGPSGPLSAPLGSSLVLLCYADSPLLIEGLKVEWRRTDSETLVLLFEDGEIQAEAQQQDYHCRANFLTNHIKHGNFSLRLDNLTVKDEGEYECKVYSQQDSGETVVQIIVERLMVSGSDFVFAHEGEDVTLNCSVDSHIPPELIEEVSWVKIYEVEEIMVLLYQNNETLSNASNEQYRDRVEFFTDEVPKGNFSLRLKNVTYEDRGSYECRVFAGGASVSAQAILGWEYGPCSDSSETKMKLVEHLALDKNDNVINKMGPLMFYEVLYVYVDLYMSSIIDVNEKAQSLTTQVKLIMAWSNWKLARDKESFCGMETFVAPKNLFWTPDIGIIESLKTEFGTKESPYVKLFYFGYTASSDILSLTTACKIDLYRFPFYIYQLIYQITIKRRPLLYVINIILPMFFFVVLDVVSFFIEASAADKLNFKVTLLLSISVFLLMVNDTLPSTTDKLPLIGVYCSVIFILIGISILETILVKFLIAKGAERRSVETRVMVNDQVGDQITTDSVTDQNEEQACTLELLKQILTECRAGTQRNQPEKMCLCWTRVARTIDMTFLVLNIITIIAFLSRLGDDWFP